ncbi:MAG: hypothetical protein WA208_14680 [Thermoanaerobaculia bacterium]
MSLPFRHAVFAILCAAALWVTAPELARGLERAGGLAGQPYSSRRMAVMPGFYESVRNYRLALPHDTSIAVVLAQRPAIDRGVLVNYYLYPRRVRFFSGLDHYRTAGEARPPMLVYVDLTQGEEVRWMTYEQVRREHLSKSRTVRSPQPFTLPSRDLIVPFVASLDGWPPDIWVTEAVFASEEPAHLTLRFHPSGEAKQFELLPGEPLVFGDLADEVFGGLRSGWIEARSDRPMRAGAWLVNRGRGHATPVHIFATTPQLPQRVPAGDRLWVVNAGGSTTVVRVDGRDVELPPHALRDLGPHAAVEVTATAPVIAFTSRRDGTGPTVFGWPEARR